MADEIKQTNAVVVSDSNKVLPVLRAHLPYTATVFHRIQHGPHTPTTQILASNLPGSQDYSSEQPWTVGILDRSRQPGTEMWLFSSIELPNDTKNEETLSMARHQVLTILNNVHPLQASITGDMRDYGTTILLGSTHTSVVSVLDSDNIIARASQAYGKLPFSSTDPSLKLNASGQSTPPKGLLFDVVKPQDYARIKETNSIIRSESMIAGLSSIAARETATGKAVAWAFLDIDGSIRTVFVEPEWRGQGLAKKVIRRLIDKEGARLKEKDRGKSWVSADVEASNEPSLRLFKAFGARRMWDVKWVWVDLMAVRQVIEHAAS